MNGYYGGYQPQQSIIWVQGLEGAKAYPVAAGNSVLLMDNTENVFYIKTTDQSGMPNPIRVFDYKERTEKPKTEYVTKEDLEKALSDLRRMKKVDK